MSKANKANKAESKPVAIEATPKPVEAVEAVESLEAIKAKLTAAMKAGDVEAVEKLVAAKIKAEKLEAKKHADYVKANEQKFIDARIAFASYISATVDSAISAYEDANGSIADALGDKLNAIRITLAGAVDKTGTAQANTSAALQLASAKKASTGSHAASGNYNCGERGNMLGSGMSAEQIVAKFGSDEDKAEIAKLEGKAQNSKQYFTARRLLKANNII